MTHPNGTECYSELLENEISGGSSTADLMSIFNKCATVNWRSKWIGRGVLRLTMVGLQSQESDVLLLQLNATSVVLTSFDMMTYASFNLITLNESEYISI